MIALTVAILALTVSAATPDQRLIELETKVNSMESELRYLYMKVEGTSHHEKRLTENELKVSLLYSKLLTDEDRFDTNNQKLDENDQAMTQKEESGSKQGCSCEIN